ncbi:hypothetical protein HNQ07_002608 [Deinococcus metalli]|uniref:Uncharacterized protein n=1 Tax=Deinococcus metalli TaxID=1141878 RepID=A0A7W8NQS2_9DEIO|nr:hypothetical protein [Deinococcus metalli]MBB5377135.1 hypothetical protein [Deinococcus metalli]GHF48735.1 hypothetical protein GCM10017781_26400 [Deinococcus metalli]
MPTKGSTRVQALIEGVLEERAARGVGGDLPESKVTVRLSAPDAFWLAQLAELMDASRTRAAAQLLSAAIRDAAHTAHLPTEGDAFRDALRAFMEHELHPDTDKSPP